MYRINGKSVPGFGCGMLLFITLIFFELALQKMVLIAIACWILIDILCFISMKREPKEIEKD